MTIPVNDYSTIRYCQYTLSAARLCPDDKAELMEAGEGGDGEQFDGRGGEGTGGEGKRLMASIK